MNSSDFFDAVSSTTAAPLVVPGCDCSGRTESTAGGGPFSRVRVEVHLASSYNAAQFKSVRVVVYRLTDDELRQ